MYRPTASTRCTVREELVAFWIVASMTRMCACWQSRSATSPLCVWYQTTETLPASPAAIHGQKTRAFAGAATSIGPPQDLPRLDVHIIRMRFGAADGPPLQPPVVLALR